MLQIEKILDIVKSLEPKLIEERRRFHENAELSGVEFETMVYILDEMTKLGLEPVWIREPVSAYFVFDTGKPGKTLALRADIDALPIDEDEYNLKQKKAVVSKNAGACHACGHDGHAAMLMSIARAVVANKDELCGRFIFFFESAEEGEAEFDCAELFCDVLKTLKPDAVWGMHICGFMDCGKISVQAGPRMASPGCFEIKIIGRGGHGSKPYQSINPLNTAAELVTKLQTIISTKIPTDEIATLAVTAINGGDTWNIIPDTCTVLGNFRCCSQKIYNLIGEQIRLITESVCAANSCSFEYIKMPNGEVIRPVVNDPEISAIAEAALDKILPGARIQEPIWMGSESFGSYQRVVPGVFAFIGVRNEELGSGAAHHNAKFDMDERGLALGVATTLQFVSDFMG